MFICDFFGNKINFITVFFMCFVVFTCFFAIKTNWASGNTMIMKTKGPGNQN